MIINSSLVKLFIDSLPSKSNIKSRTSRSEYVLANIALFSFSFIFALMFDFVMGFHLDDVSFNIDQLQTSITPLFIMKILMFPLGMVITIRRLHDLGLNGWCYLILIIPLINILFFLNLILAPGDKTDNLYGAPREPVILTLFDKIWLFIFMPLIAFCGIYYAIYG